MPSPLEIFNSVLPVVLKNLEDQKSVPLTGLPGGSKALFLVSLAAQTQSPILVVVPEDVEAEGIAADVEAWSALLPSKQRPPLFVFPEMDSAGRIAALGQWKENPRAIVT